MGWKRLVTVLVLLGMAVVPGCLCGRKRVEGPEPVVHPLCLEASPRLNWYDGRANTLFVRLFQLSTPDAFLQADASRLLERDVTLPGAQGAPLERTLFPGKKETLDVRQDPDALYLGVVAGYFKLDGLGKTHRKLPPPPDDEKKEKTKSPPCIVFGPNGIEAQ